jgi:hypothetical protein
MNGDLNIGYISATQKANAKDTPLWRSMTELGINFDVDFYEKNRMAG